MQVLTEPVCPLPSWVVSLICLMGTALSTVPTLLHNSCFWKEEGWRSTGSPGYCSATNHTLILIPRVSCTLSRSQWKPACRLECVQLHHKCHHNPQYARVKDLSKGSSRTLWLREARIHLKRLAQSSEGDRHRLPHHVVLALDGETMQAIYTAMPGNGMLIPICIITSPPMILCN